MEELLANADDASQLLYTIIERTLLFGGLAVALVLLRYHRRHPPETQALTAEIASRSWTTLQLGVVLASLFTLHLLASFSGLLFYEEQIPLARLVITLIIYAIIMGIITVINHKRGGSWAESCGMGVGNLKKLGLSPVFYLAMIPFLVIVTKAYHLLLEKASGTQIELQEVAQIVTQDLSWLQVLYILTAIFVAPLYEELVFRGLLFPYLVKRSGLLGATVLVSALFAFMHFHTPSLLPLFMLSATLCLVYWRTGSLWVGIGLHAIFNAISIFALNVVG